MSNLCDKLIEIANSAGKIPGVKRFLKPFYYPFKVFFERRKNKVFRKEYVIEVGTYFILDMAHIKERNNS